jgi:hypothetical protein
VEIDPGRARVQRATAATLEKKTAFTVLSTVFTFLSQGAVGGAAGYFLVAAGNAISRPSGYNFLYLIFVPIFLVFGAAFGSVAGIFVWLPGALLKKRTGFVTRTFIVTTAAMPLAFALSQMDGREVEQWSLSWAIGFISVMSLPVVLMTGSSISPCRMLVLGVGPRRTRQNFGSWLSYPVGFLLRVASIFGLLEALMTLALWISARRSEWFTSPAREYLPGIVLAVLYFATSTYLSIRSPRKSFLLATAILLNLPLALLTLNLRQVGTEASNFLVYAFPVFISLWAAYTLLRLIAPEAGSSVGNSLGGTVAAQKVSLSDHCQVHL